MTLTNNHLCNNDKFLGFVVHRFDCGSNVHVLTKLLTNIVPTTCSTFETIYQIINFQAFWETNRVKKNKKNNCSNKWNKLKLFFNRSRKCAKYLRGVTQHFGICDVFALYDYSATRDDEITFNSGDRLTVIRRGDDQVKRLVRFQK